MAAQGVAVNNEASVGVANYASHPFYSLPCELFLDIIDLLPPEAFINFAFASYPLLVAKGVVPKLSSYRIADLVNRTRIRRHFRLLPVPTEVLLQVLSCLKPIDIVRFVMANYGELQRQGIAPALSTETLAWLRRAVPAVTIPG